MKNKKLLSLLLFSSLLFVSTSNVNAEEDN